ncbi:ABC transporter ATP-binding protein [Clostridium sp. BJN0001]|uniref:ABC transporter ATP-binding protein n=1 Tax=Clostridium sp. BJN0001 TaxID=2930219 RepID=UPI001FD0AC9B|nr:ABC transporter ATP-binding protein [Clostridium sp. BJN0001]
MPRHGNMKAGPKPKNAIKTFKRILSYMKEFKFRLFLVAILIIISSAASIAVTYFLKPLINNYIIPFIGKQNPDLSGFIKMIIIMIGICVLGSVSTYIYNRLMIQISTKSLYKIRTDMFDKMEKLPIKYFDTHTHGELMSRFTNDTDTLRDMFSQSFTQFIASAITVTGVFITMLILSPVLTILVVLMLVVIVKIIKVFGKKSSKYFLEQQKKMGKLNGYIEEMMDGQKVIKVFCHEENVKKEFDVINDELKVSAREANTFASILMPVMNNVSYAHYAITAMAGGILAVYGMMDIGTLASFLQYTRSFAQPITQISQQFNSIIMALAGAERIFDLIDQIKEADNGYVTLVNAKIDEDGNIKEVLNHTGMWAWKHPHHNGVVTYTMLKGEVTLDDVYFGYNENKVVLKGITLYAKKGQKIAFVGSTGAGKTTITNLLNRFYDIHDGKIRYDGINIDKIKKDDLRRALAMVLQDTHLFTGTVMENIRYGNLKATDEQVIEAAKLANADTFINHLPKGYDTMLTSDGSNLSEGQRQLLSIARAAVADPPVLILDEATSSIDTRTEYLIQKGMDKLMQGRTVFVIAHRLSTVRNSDAIMVLEDGEIIERGDHDALLKQRGKYYSLYTGMFELS